MFFINMENNKKDKPHKFVLNLSQRLDLQNLGRNITLQNLSIY